jgi:protein FAM50
LIIPCFFEYRAKEKAQKKKSKKEAKSKLSFAMDDDGEEDADLFKPNKKAKRETETTLTKKTTLKNPAVDTSFLPDRDREEKDRLAREELRQEWLKKQELMKAEAIEIIYSYWDGSGHRNSLTVSAKMSTLIAKAHSFVHQCKKGDTISAFLDKCRQQVSELRHVSVDSLMYIKVRLSYQLSSGEAS